MVYYRLCWFATQAPDTPNSERGDHRQAVLERRLRDALAELNHNRPLSALEDASGPPSTWMARTGKGMRATLVRIRPSRKQSLARQ